MTNRTKQETIEKPQPELNSEYTNMVAEFIKEDSTAIFGNLSTAHAANICEQFIKSAETNIEIFSGSMKEVFYSDNGIFKMLKETANKLRRSGAIRIITINASAKDASALKKRLDEVNTHSTIDYRPASYNGDDKEISHFMLVDGKRYRIEKPHDAFTEMPKEVKAEVCCNSPEVVKEKKDFFDTIWTHLGDLRKNGSK